MIDESLLKKSNQIKNNEVTINIDEYHMLLQKEDVSPDLKVTIVAKDVSELSLDELEKSEGKFSVTHVKLEDQCLGIKDNAPYTLQEYELCQKKIDDLIKDVIIPPMQTPNREKIIWGQVTKILAKYIKYNTEYEAQLKTVLSKIAEYKQKYSPEELEQNEQYLALLAEKEKMVTPQNYNMVGGLLNQTCTCSGYAEIVRNVFSKFGIEVCNAKGKRENGISGHSWNQINLDGEWFNIDIVKEKDAIIDEWEYVVNDQGYLLMSDEDFDKDIENYGASFETESIEGHHVYSCERVSPHKCTRTIPCEEWIQYLQNEDIKGIPYHMWKNQGVTLQNIQQAVQHNRRRKNNPNTSYTRLE